MKKFVMVVVVFAMIFAMTVPAYADGNDLYNEIENTCEEYKDYIQKMFEEEDYEATIAYDVTKSSMASKQVIVVDWYFMISDGLDEQTIVVKMYIYEDGKAMANGWIFDKDGELIDIAADTFDDYMELFVM